MSKVYYWQCGDVKVTTELNRQPYIDGVPCQMVVIGDEDKEGYGTGKSYSLGFDFGNLEVPLPEFMESFFLGVKDFFEDLLGKNYKAKILLFLVAILVLFIYLKRK